MNQLPNGMKLKWKTYESFKARYNELPEETKSTMSLGKFFCQEYQVDDPGLAIKSTFYLCCDYIEELYVDIESKYDD